MAPLAPPRRPFLGRSYGSPAVLWFASGIWGSFWEIHTRPKPTHGRLESFEGPDDGPSTVVSSVSWEALGALL